MIFRWLVLIAILAFILTTPVPAELSVEAWKIFAVYCAAILGLILRPASESVVMINVLAFGALVVPVGQLLTGYASTTVWLAFSVFLISQAFADTGLGMRVAC